MTPPPDTHHNPSRATINTNTGIGLGLMLVVIAAAWTLRASLSDVKNEVSNSRSESQQQISSFKQEVNANFEAMKLRVGALENNKNTVSGIEFLRWAIHLQQLNKDPKRMQLEGLRVPEIEEVTK